jgi:UDP-N-acetylmuramate--alanine ligase
MNINKIRKIHFMGVGGSGIAGVANLAKRMGYRVSGCDLKTGGHDIVHLKNVDLVVVTPAVFYQSGKHPEVVEAKKRGILMTWQEFLGKYLHKGKKVICVAGTHGKSTITAMAGKLLQDAGFDPLVVVGAKVPEWGSSFRFGQGKYFVTEADEFYDNFLHYRPEIVILNNIEFDHPDYFKSEAEVKKSFRKFIKRLKGKKILITQKDSLHKRFNLKIFGEHNQKNANMVYLLGKKLGISDEKIISSIESFTGIERRMQLIGEKRGIKVFDDYAHHPTAIAATLAGLRERYPKNRIWAIIEPHGFVRTHALLAKYKGVFKHADKVIIGPIFKARDAKTLGMNPEKIAKSSGHPEAIGVNSFAQIVKIIKKEIKTGDVILVMGAGKSNLWARNILKIIQL